MKCKCYTKIQSTCLSVQGESFPQPFPVSDPQQGNSKAPFCCSKNEPGAAWVWHNGMCQTVHGHRTQLRVPDSLERGWLCGGQDFAHPQCRGKALFSLAITEMSFPLHLPSCDSPSPNIPRCALGMDPELLKLPQDLKRGIWKDKAEDGVHIVLYHTCIKLWIWQACIGSHGTVAPFIFPCIPVFDNPL